MIKKQCTKCKSVLPFSEFHKWKYGKDGYKSCCKKCNTKDVTSYQKTPRGRQIHLRNSCKYERTEKGKRNKKRYVGSDKGCIMVKERSRKNRERFPEKCRARDVLNNAVKSGKIKAPSNCIVCSKRRKLHGHHDDYDNPLEVRWMCQKCHDTEHGRLDDPWAERVLDELRV